MTREEAIKRLKEYAQYSYGIWHNDEEDTEAFNMAIESLSAEAVQGVGRYEKAMQKLREMPRCLNGVKVKQINKIQSEAVQGEWKRVETRTYKGECTNCGFRHIFMDGHDSQYRFCPYCGAKMSKGGDSE